MVKFESDVRRYKCLEKGDEKRLAQRGKLNRTFASRLERHKRQYGGGACFEDYHYPVEGSATLYLAAYEGNTSEEADDIGTSEVELSEGDTATIGVDEHEFRLKFYGIKMERMESEQVNNKIVVNYCLDKWEDGEWHELHHSSGTSGVVTETHRGATLRIAIAEAPGFNAEDNFSNLVDHGLTPAEALDYWMVDVRHHPQTEWAEKRGKTQQAISKNVGQAREKLPDVSEERPLAD